MALEHVSEIGRCQTDFAAKHLNTEDIQSLSSDIFSSHIDDTFHPEAGTDRSGGHAVLASTRLCYDTCFAYSAC